MTDVPSSLLPILTEPRNEYDETQETWLYPWKAGAKELIQFWSLRRHNTKVLSSPA